MAEHSDGAPNAIYSALRERILAGAFSPGVQLKAVELAAGLRVSATPVREALFRLVGEGLIIDLPHHGFFVPQLSGELLSELYQMSLIYLRAAIALGDGGRGPVMPSDRRIDGGSADMFAALADHILARPGNAVLLSRGRWPIMCLAPVRRVERLLLGGAVGEEMRHMTEALEAGERGPLLRAIEAYHRKRLKMVTSLAVALRPKIS